MDLIEFIFLEQLFIRLENIRWRDLSRTDSVRYSVILYTDWGEHVSHAGYELWVVPLRCWNAERISVITPNDIVNLISYFIRRTNAHM